MSESQPVYQPGSVVNGHVWTGEQWLPVQQSPSAPKPRSPWRVVAGIACLIGAALAGLQGLSWLIGFNDLDSQGNQFAGVLAVLGLGAGAVALGFLVAGINLLTKK